MEQAEAYLNQIPMWTREKHSLEEVREYLDALGSPDRGLPAVHIAGTNGKGSVCAFLTSVLAEAGYRVGTFTSPHLVDIRERFQINGAMISREAFSQGFNEVLRMVREMEEKGHTHPSFFEFLFYMAMVIFREARVDVMVIETGLGGRLDATNVLEHPAAVVITSISLDHTEYLGDTIEKIAGEKAGIIKAGVPVIFDDSIPSVRTVIEGTAFRRGAARYPVRAADCQVEGIQAGHLEMTARLLRGGSLHLSIPFEAVYQAQNAMLAVRTLEVLRGPGMREGISCRSEFCKAAACVPCEGGENRARQEAEGAWNISNRQIEEGIRKTSWPGRMEQIRPGFYLDGAHNPGGIEAFLRTAGEIAGRRGKKAYLLFGALSDKAYETMIQMLAENFAWTGIGVVSPEGPRGVPADQMARDFKRWTACPVRVYREAREALADMRALAGDELLFCTGSLYLAGDVRRILKEEEQ